MKLFIELEVAPEEIHLATELRTLRLLTDHVKIRDLKKLMTPLIARFKHASELEKVASEITVVSELDGSDLVYEELVAAFEEVVFSQEMVMRQESVVQYMLLLPRLPERAQLKIKELLIPKVLKHLKMKRSLDASRMEFFAYAEAFASLVHMGFVPIAGAVRSIVTLLQKPETRCAAVTMLGKTVELCLQQLTDSCDPNALLELRLAIRNITEPHFQYDINYIGESMGWSRGLNPSINQTSQARIVDEVPSSSGLHAVDSFYGHKSTIFAMSFDNKRNQLVSGGKDGSIYFWSSDGQVIDSVAMAQHYACSMDLQSASQTLLVCGVGKEEARDKVSPCIFRYGMDGGSWKEQGCLLKEKAKLISCIKSLAGFDPGCITGETFVGTKEGFHDERVCYYDFQASSFPTLKPLREYQDHEDLITCLSLFPTNSNIFMSASRDCSVRVWDRRADRCAGMFGTPRPTTGRTLAHDGMVTSLDATDTNMIVSASMDKFLHRWDYRTLSSQGPSAPVSSLQLDDTAILKVVLKPGTGIAAISTLRGLYFADFYSPRPVARLANPFPDARHVGRYHDMKWSAAKNILYTCGDDNRVDDNLVTFEEVVFSQEMVMRQESVVLLLSRLPQRAQLKIKELLIPKVDEVPSSSGLHAVDFIPLQQSMQVIDSVAMAQHYACSMDLPQTSCIKSLPGFEPGCITRETFVGNKEGYYYVQASSFPTQKPLREDFNNVFMSASRDCSVDRRVLSCPGTPRPQDRTLARDGTVTSANGHGAGAEGFIQNAQLVMKPFRAGYSAIVYGLIFLLLFPQAVQAVPVLPFAIETKCHGGRALAFELIGSFLSFNVFLFPTACVFGKMSSKITMLDFFLPVLSGGYFYGKTEWTDHFELICNGIMFLWATIICSYYLLRRSSSGPNWPESKFRVASPSTVTCMSVLVVFLFSRAMKHSPLALWISYMVAVSIVHTVTSIYGLIHSSLYEHLSNRRKKMYKAMRLAAVLEAFVWLLQSLVCKEPVDQVFYLISMINCIWTLSLETFYPRVPGLPSELSLRGF